MAHHYRVGRKQPRNVYRHLAGDQHGEYIGVFFDHSDAQVACDSMNKDHDTSDSARMRRQITREALLSAAEWLDRAKPHNPAQALRDRARYGID